MSPTPEADAAERMAWAGEYMVPTEVARKLERERDEAKRRCLRWLEEWHLTDRARCDMKSERDESRGAWYEMQSSFERSKTEAEQLIRERDEARDALMRIEDLFIDGTDVCADREKMGSIARAALGAAK